MITGINAPTPISVGSGEYAIDGGSYRSAAGTITNGQAVTVRMTSSADFSTAVSATLTIGLASATFTATTLAEDATPQDFAFAPQIGAALSTVVTSNTVPITGITTTTAVSVSGGEYAIGAGGYTSAAGTITNGQTVTVRLTSSANFSTAVSATLTIGSAAATFTVTTLAADTTPDDFNFTPQTGVPLHAEVTSNIVIISGINTATAVAVSGSPGSAANYSIDRGSFAAGNSTVNNGQTLQVRLTSSNSLATTATATLTVGGVSKIFSATTGGADTTPDAFSFTSQTNMLPNTLVTSNTMTVSGINSAANISVSGGEYRIGNGNTWTSAAGTVDNGDSVRVRHTSSSSGSTTVTTTLTIGTGPSCAVSASFSSTTRP
ncbi:MAG: hypothetical protein EXQ59_04880 [Acidobacteria bacterium]|nr:hypothetical protein [Acidobacteriota bacterium]